MKAYVPRIPKMWYFLGLAVFKVELLALKVRSNFKKKIPIVVQRATGTYSSKSGGKGGNFD